MISYYIIPEIDFDLLIPVLEIVSNCMLVVLVCLAFLYLVELMQDKCRNCGSNNLQGHIDNSVWCHDCWTKYSN